MLRNCALFDKFMDIEQSLAAAYLRGIQHSIVIGLRALKCQGLTVSNIQ